MNLSIFNDIWTKLTEFSDDCYDFMMNHYDEPVLWIVIAGVLLIVCYSAISNIANK